MLRLFLCSPDFHRNENERPFAYTLNPAMAKLAGQRTATRSDKTISCLQLLPLRGIGEIHEGDDLSAMLVAAARKWQIRLKTGDILVIAQKVISKSEGRAVNLSSVEPSSTAARLAAKRKRDARLVEVVLR